MLVVGGGYIGLEMVENLHRRDLTITLVEKGTQVLPSLDPEMALPLKTHLTAAGVQEGDTVILSGGYGLPDKAHVRTKP